MTVRQQLLVVIAIAVVAVAALAGAKHFLGDEISPLGTGAKAPNFQAATLDTPSRLKTLADYKGQVVLLNVWATWCEPCRAEMPSMQQLQTALGTKGLKIVAVSIDGPGSEAGITAFARQYGLTFEILHDSAGSIQTAYQMTGVPESMLIGRDGVIRKKVAGATDWASPPNQALIERLLAE